MIFKSYLLENNLKEIYKFSFFLFYGENLGLLKYFKKRIINENKDKEIINLFSSEIIKNQDNLFNEVKNSSLFHNEKIILINDANDKMLEILEMIINETVDVKVFLFSDPLEKKSKIRNYFEKSKSLGITACYQDNEIGIRKIILEQLKNYKNLTNEVINIITKVSGMDREKVNNEIEKIKTYFQDKVINIEDLDKLLNITINEDFNRLKNEALCGNKRKTNELLTDTAFDNEDSFYYLSTLNQRIFKLIEIENLKEKNSNVEAIVSNLKPPVFWKEKPILILQSKKWNKENLKLASQKTYEVELKLKSESSVKKDLLIKNLLVELCAAVSHV